MTNKERARAGDRRHPLARKLGFRLGALLLGVVLACIVTEVFVLVVYGEQAKFPRHVVEAEWGLRYNEPGARYRHKSADVNIRLRINAQGMRADHDYSYSKPEGVKRIVSLGDSFTIGYEVDVEQCFSSVLERELNDAGIRVEVLNCGVSGFSNAEECLYLERELMKYAPDLVLVSFYGNDLVDNVRTGLFRLADNELVETKWRYVPAGRLGNFLNTNWFFNQLSARSNAFVLIKERLTSTIKRKMVEQNVDNLKAAGGKGAEDVATTNRDSKLAGEDQKRLAAAIFTRIKSFLGEHGIPLVIHTIPSRRKSVLIDVFPLEYMDFMEPGVMIVSAKSVLEAEVGQRQLYWDRSHSHWTPDSHLLAGKALAKAIVESGSLE